MESSLSFSKTHINHPNSEWLFYNELPEIAKRAVEVCPYFLEDGDIFNSTSIKFRLEVIPLEEAKKRCMDNSPDLSEDFFSFEEYHHCYRMSDNTDHGDSIFPCIVSSLKDEWLLDGWHRFHYYVSKAIPNIPLLYYISLES